MHFSPIFTVHSWPANILMARLRVKLLVKYTSVVAVIYFLVVIIVTMSRSDDPHSELISDMMLGKRKTSALQSGSGVANMSRTHCDVIHVAIVVSDTAQVLQYTSMLKTLIYFRDNPISLHVIATPASRHVISTLFNSWTIPGVEPHYYTTDMASKASRGATELDVLKVKLKLHSLLPASVTKVIMLDYRIRFATDIARLWEEFKQFSKTMTMELYRYTVKDVAHYAPDVLLIHLGNWRVLKSTNVLPAKDSWENVFSWFEMHRKGLRQLPCEWQVRLQPNFSITDCLKTTLPLAFWWDEKSVKYTSVAEVEQLRLVLTSIEQNDGELLRHSSSPCYKVPYEKYNLTKTCEEFRYASKIRRRTHLYIYGEYQENKSNSANPNDVTLVTQLTPDRFGVLERMASQWKGPLHAVFHVTDQEALSLPSLAHSSKIIKARRNIAFHAVYKRGKFYPINYMRNVGINQCVTPYTLFVDVDLVPNSGLYEAIKKRIPTDMSKPKETLVVPAFDALKPLPVFPDSKTELLKLLENHTVEGYKMSRGWNLGHKPTDYPKWKTAKEPYLAVFKDAFEPYVVMATKNQPQFEETLLERMGDKIAYGRILYAMGYTMKILPDQFVIHLPHPDSKGTSQWRTYPSYNKCSGILFEEFRKETKQKYPWQKVH